MGANVELDIFLKKEGFFLQPILSLFKKEGLYVSIQEIRIFDDWEYTNEVSVDASSIDLNTSNIFLEKFSLIHFNISNRWRCTLMTSLVEESYIDLSFGFDTNDLLQRSEKSIDDYVAVFYSKVTDIIDDTSRKEEFKDRFMLACMGIEYSVHFNDNLMMMLNDDNGVKRWILPKNVGRDIVLKNFVKEEKNNTLILTRFY